jgi:phosphoenolpyruvate synthase/pyruvate phosphate dikinase
MVNNASIKKRNSLYANSFLKNKFFCKFITEGLIKPRITGTSAIVIIIGKAAGERKKAETRGENKKIISPIRLPRIMEIIQAVFIKGTISSFSCIRNTFTQVSVKISKNPKTKVAMLTRPNWEGSSNLARMAIRIKVSPRIDQRCPADHETLEIVVLK